MSNVGACDFGALPLNIQIIRVRLAARESESHCHPSSIFDGCLLAVASRGECLQEVMLGHVLSASHVDPRPERSVAEFARMLTRSCLPCVRITSPWPGALKVARETQNKLELGRRTIVFFEHQPQAYTIDVCGAVSVAASCRDSLSAQARRNKKNCASFNA